MITGAGAVELRNALGSKFGMELPPTVIFDFPSVASLAGHLATTLAVTSAPAMLGMAGDYQPGDLSDDGSASDGERMPVRASRRRGHRRGQTGRTGGAGAASAAAPSAAELEASILGQLAALVESVLGASVGPHQPLMEAGLDSLGEGIPLIGRFHVLLPPHMPASRSWTEHLLLQNGAGAVELRNSLSSKFGLELPPTIILDYPTITALAGHLASASAALAAGGADADVAPLDSADASSWSDAGSSSCWSSSPSQAALTELLPPAPLVVVTSVSGTLPGSTCVTDIAQDAPSGTLPSRALSPPPLQPNFAGWIVCSFSRTFRIDPRSAAPAAARTASPPAAVPLERWDADVFAAVSPNALEARFGSFVAGAQLFDASAFAISRPEATYMDPQQRLLLRHAAEALWGAAASSTAATLGQVAAKPTGGLPGVPDRCGVMVGIGPAEYVNQTSELLPMGMYFATGGAISVAAGRCERGCRRLALCNAFLEG